MTRNFAIAAAVIVAALIGVTTYVAFSGGGDDPFAKCRETAVAAGSAEIGGPFTLISETGETVTDKDVIDKPTLLYFGYTYCPDVCPLDNARNAEAVELLEGKGLIVKPVFISVDPERDTPEVLREFTDYLHPRMLGLTGSPAQVKAASKAYRTYYQKQPAADGEDEFYLVDHSTFTYLVLPKIGFVEFFRRAASAEDMARRVQCFVEAAG